MTIADVRLWGRTIGAVSLDEDEEFASFEYTPEFVGSGIEVSPLRMPLANKVYQFPELPKLSFHGLPGLLADSLPDKFGDALINEWLARQGRRPESFNAVERLCYTGSRGMGALEFLPNRGPRQLREKKVVIDELVRLASEILVRRGDLDTKLGGNDDTEAMKDILKVGTSAGGARAKAIIAWNPKTNEVRSGQISAESDFQYWLLKFDGVSGNRDKELNHLQGFGAIEYAYFLMATAAGIEMSECRLLEENGRRHFMTKRFDRTDNGQKLHMQSLAGIAHFDFNSAGAYSYEQALFVFRQLGLPMSAVEQQFRRMVFNIVARDQDDHVKNIAFLMDKTGRWTLAPAFDVTYSYNTSGEWTSKHQMTLNGKRDDFDLSDFKACAAAASLKRGRAEAIIAEVSETVRRWPEFAESAGVNSNWIQTIEKTFRLK